MAVRWRAFVALCLTSSSLASTALARDQTQAGSVRFEVASIKQNVSGWTFS